MIPKFRGKRVDNGEWVEGHLLKDERDFCYIVRPQNIGAIYAKGSINGTHDIVIVGCCEVIPETVGQFTGLEDKNEKEIFGSISIDGIMSKGGDIVQEYFESLDTTTQAQKVLWIDEMACFGLKPSHPYDYSSLAFSDKREVIGNQTDNPELLK